LGSQPPVPQNSNANPLNQSPSAQPSNVAPRYANPYAREQPASSLGGSRWGNQQQSSSTGQAPRPNSQPQENQYTEHAVTAQNGYSVSPGQTQPPENQYTRNLVIQNSAQSGQPIQGYGERTGPSPREAAAPSRATSQRQAAPSQPTVALEGYCPVTLIDNRGWLVGNKRWGAVHEGHIYLFAGQEQQQKFLRNPHLYAPLNAGYDPVVYAETGQRVPGKRVFGLYIEDPGPIALFADEASLQRFEQNAGYYYDALSQAAAQRRQQQR
jgi:protein disulfide-isomerase